MIKSRDKGASARVTFTLPAAVHAASVAICGEWNDWSPDRDVMHPVDEGFSLTMELQTGRAYRFRYLLDGSHWENDWDADAYVPNAYGGDDSVVDLTAETIVMVPSGDESSVEQQATLLAPAGMALPDLSTLIADGAAVALPEIRLDAMYYDTANVRLARSGITLSHRGGEPGRPWTVQLPEDGSESDLGRREVGFDGPPSPVPNSAADLVLASTRALALEPVASLTTVRLPTQVRDNKGRVVAQVVDDTVTVVRDQGPAESFREIQVALYVSGPEADALLQTTTSRLVAAGCWIAPAVPTLVRALGEPATLPPDVVVPSLPAEATLTDLVRHAAARSVAQILQHDPGARLGDDPEDVHKLRVATRRLRSDLHTFGPVLEPARVAPVREELKWLAGVMGAVRDIDVLSARLSDRLAKLPAADAPGGDRLLLRLEQDGADARATMLTLLRDARYLQLLDVLVELAGAPPFLPEPPLTKRKSRKVAAHMVQKPWRHVADAVYLLDDDPTDAELHHIRILAKRSRYAAEAAAPVLGETASLFAAAVADLQTVLGAYQDTVFAESWLSKCNLTSPRERETVSHLVALERAERRQLRAQWPAAWRHASGKKLHTWH